MKALHVIPAIAARYGGPSAAVVEMCAALENRNVETTIAATDADGTGRLTCQTGNGERPRVLLFRRQWSESFKYSRPLAAWLSQRVRSYDVVHVHAVLSHACLAAGRACRAAGVPYVVRPLGTLDPWSLGQKALKKRLLLWAAGRRLLTNAAAVHYTSRQEKALVEASLGLTAGVVIPLGVSEAVPANRTAARDDACPYVLSLSRLHPVKRLETLIDAFGRATAGPTELRGWRLTIAGDGAAEYVAQLKRLAGERGMDGRVRFTGWIDGADKRALLQGASLFAVPSLHESFGVSLVEALACGVPAVVSPQVQLAADIEEAGAGWVAHGEAGRFAETLEAAMRDSDERRRRGEAARLLAQRFAWPAVAQQLVDLYESISRRRSAPRPA